MIGARFVHPEWWPAWVGAGVCLAIALPVALAWSRVRLRRLVGRALPPLAPTALRDGLLALALACAALAWVGPLWSERTVRISTAGVDVMLLFDLSRSMDAEDNPPSRLARARRGAVGLLAGLSPGTRVGLAGFAGRGAVFAPLGPDHGALSELVGGVRTGLVGPGGSRLGLGLEAAASAFEPASRRPRVIVVWSDGETRGEDRSALADLARRLGARIVGVALGSERGATLPDHGVPLRDAAGEVVLSRRVAESLRALAEASDGRLLVADAWGAVDPAALVAAVERDRSAGGGSWIERRVPASAAAVLCAVALFCLLAELLVPRSRLGFGGGAGPGRRRRRSLVAAAAGLATLGLGREAVAPVEPGRAALEARALESRLAGRPDSPLELLELGVLRAQAGDPGGARVAFLQAALLARDPTLAALAEHDLGVLALDEEDWVRARDHFFDALALDPALSPSRRNLEWTLRVLAGRAPPPSEPEPQEPGSRDDPEAGEASPPAVDPVEPDPETRGADASAPEPADSPGAAEPAARSEEADRGRGSSADGPTGPLLDAAERRRWLDRVQEDPGRGLRAAAGLPPTRRPGAAGGPTW